jgi:uncharacterized protein (TIGR02117 family)
LNKKTEIRRGQKIIFQDLVKSSSQVQRKWFSAPCLLIVLTLSLFIVSACSTKPHVLKQTEIGVPGSREIYVVRQGWHTGFVVPSSTIQTQLPQLYERFGDTPYMAFGWGDKEYYQAEQITSGLTVKAILWPTESVMKVVAIPERPDIHFTENDLEALCLDSKQYALLIGFIENSFYKDSDGKLKKSKNSSDRNSQFYSGEGQYYSMNTCNNWTAKGLKSAGLNISPNFKQTAGSVMGYLSRHRDVYSGCVSPD